MSTPRKLTDRLVGTLSLWDPDTDACSRPFAIHVNDDVYIGRNPVKCRLIIDDSYISNVHAWVYCFVFEEAKVSQVAPLVFIHDLSRNGIFLNGEAISQEGVLLSNHDTLRFGTRIHLKFISIDDKEDWFTPAQKLELQQIKPQYSITQRVLGSGGFGRVHMAYRKRDQKQMACKVMDLRNSDSAETKRSIRMCKQEVKFLSNISHPNILEMETAFQSDNTLYVVMELFTAGDLYSYIGWKGGHLEDENAAWITQQLLLAVEYLHSQGIVHRDIKSDNILMSSLNDGCRVVLCDFGCSKFFGIVDPVRMKSMCGTRQYHAPEIRNEQIRLYKGYTAAIDIWALGIVVVMMLTSQVPFTWESIGFNESLQQLCQCLRNHSVKPFAQDFLGKIFVEDDDRRITANRALKDPWFVSYTVEINAKYGKFFGNWKEKVCGESAIIDLNNIPRRLALEGASSQLQVNTISQQPINQVESQITTPPRRHINHTLSRSLRQNFQVRPSAHPPMHDVEQQASAPLRLPSIDRESGSFSNEAARGINQDGVEPTLLLTERPDIPVVSDLSYQPPSYINDISRPGLRRTRRASNLISPIAPIRSPLHQRRGGAEHVPPPFPPCSSLLLKGPETEQIFPTTPFERQIRPEIRFPLPPCRARLGPPRHEITRLIMRASSAPPIQTADQESDTHQLDSGKQKPARRIYGQDVDLIGQPF